MTKEQITAEGIYSTEALKFAHGIKAGDVLYTSGIVARGPDGEIVGKGDVEAQAHQVYQNLEAILAAAGATWNDVVKYNTYLANPRTGRRRERCIFSICPTTRGQGPRYPCLCSCLICS